MQDPVPSFSPDLRGLKPSDWLAELTVLSEEHGFFQPLGRSHSAAFVEDGDTLLVSFETFQGIQTLSPTATPLGFDFVRDQGWSNLTVFCSRDTWFRENLVYGFFDKLIDDGFFDDFEKVIFYGAGPCGYAAAAFSVACPGAKVLALQPQATLDPRVTEWDDRFTHMRRTAFTDRYGYAPDMLDAAQHAHVVYDPREALDAMHAALFTRRNVTKLRMPFLGTALQSDLLAMGRLHDLIIAAGEDRLTEDMFYRALRARRDHAPYLRKLLARLERDDRPLLAERLCQSVVARLDAPRFRRKLDALRAARTRKPD